MQLDTKEFTEKIPKKHKKQQPDTFTLDQLETIFDNCDDVQLAMGCFLGFTAGFRPGELKNMTKNNLFQLDDRKITVFDGKTGDYTVILQPWVIPIFKKYLNYIGDSEYIFPSSKKSRNFRHRQSFQQTFKELLIKCKLLIEKRRNPDNRKVHMFKFYSLRHSFCTFLIERGVHPFKVQRMMRHAKIDTTRAYYTNVKDPWVLDEVDKVFSLKQEKKASPLQTIQNTEANEELDPMKILQLRLAKGDIGIEEYKQLSEALRPEPKEMTKLDYLG